MLPGRGLLACGCRWGFAFLKLSTWRRGALWSGRPVCRPPAALLCPRSRAPASGFSSWGSTAHPPPPPLRHFLLFWRLEGLPSLCAAFPGGSAVARVLCEERSVTRAQAVPATLPSRVGGQPGPGRLLPWSRMCGVRLGGAASGLSGGAWPVGSGGPGPRAGCVATSRRT